MKQLGAWLLALVGPLVVRAFIALGFTAITFVGVTEAVNQLVSVAQSHWSSMPAAVLAIAALSGIPEALGMVMGAAVSVLALWASVGASKYIFKKS